MIRAFLALLIVTTNCQICQGQISDRDSLWRRLVFLSVTGSIKEEQKLGELLRYDSLLKYDALQNDSTASLLKQRIGACYFNTRQFADAAKYFKEAIAITERHPGRLASPDLKIKNYFLLFWTCEYLDDLNTRLKSADSCIAYSLRYDLASVFAIRTLSFRTEHSYNGGDFRRSIGYAELMEKYSRKLAVDAEKSGDTSTPPWAWKFAGNAVLNHANALFRLKDYDGAERKVKDNLSLLLDPRLPKTYAGTVYQEYSEYFIAKNDYPEALHNLELALKYEELGGDTIACMAILNNIGYNIYFLHYDNPQAALTYCRKALLQRKKNNDEREVERMEILSAYNSMANIFSRLRNFDSANYYYRSAFGLISPGMSEIPFRELPMTALLKFPKAHYIAELLLDQGKSWLMEFSLNRDQKLLDKSINIFMAADMFLGQIKTLQTQLDSKLTWRANSRRLYEYAIEACAIRDDPERAFYFFEKSRSALLNDNVVEQRWFGSSDIYALGQARKKVQVLLNEQETVDRNSPRYDALRKELFSSQHELDRLNRSVLEKYPGYYNYFLDTTVNTLRQVRSELLDDHDVFLELFHSKETLFLLTVTRDFALLKQINKRRFDSLRTVYLSYLSSEEKMNQNFNGFRKISNQLYELLFGKDLINGHRIIISPDGENFPFESLVVNSSGQPHYLIQDHAVSYTYSARYLFNHFQKAKGTRPSMMGVAPIVYPGNTNLSSLPGSDQSLQQIATYFSEPYLLRGADANKMSFLSQYDRYRVIQLYTHAAEFSDRNEPVIYLADSSLYLSDLISESKPLTTLIVVSACETARGKLYQGEGTFNFNRGFAALGIPAAVTNLWMVDSKSTYLLTELFYKFLSEGYATDVALQKAKLELINSTGMFLPCYWAAPILTGRTEIIFETKTHSWPWIAGIAIGMAFAVYIVRKKRMTKQT